MYNPKLFSIFNVHYLSITVQSVQLLNDGQMNIRWCTSQANTSKMLINNGEMLVNDGEMRV